MLTVNAIGGLGNRMRAVVSGIKLARELEMPLQVVWGVNDELYARWNDLFLPSPLCPQLIHPGSLKYNLVWQEPRKKNLYLSALTQKIMYSRVLSDNRCLADVVANNRDLASVLKNHENVLISSGLWFQDEDPALLRQVFHPSERVARMVNEKLACIGKSHILGIHIRRTDNKQAIAASPIELFEAKIDEIISSSSHEIRLFVCSDSPEVINRLQKRYGDRITAGDTAATRSTLDGMLRATADLYTLASTGRILGSFYSSFSETAAALGNIPIDIISNSTQYTARN